MKASIHSLRKKTLGRKPLSQVLSRCFPAFFAKQIQNPIFIIGCARSGTTFLTGLLSLHRDIDNWSEANEIWDPEGYPWHASALETLPFVFDPIAFTNRWWQDAQARQRALRAVFGAYQWLSQKPYFLNKSPLNTFRIPQLLTIFPEARFVHVVRDGRAVAYSYALKEQGKMQAAPASYRGKGVDVPFEELVVRLGAFWRENIEEVNRQDEALSLSKNGRLIEITYEELCQDPSGTLNRLCLYLNLESSRFTQALRKETSTKSRNHKWQQALDAGLVTRVVAAMEPVLSFRGYG